MIYNLSTETVCLLCGACCLEEMVLNVQNAPICFLNAVNHLFCSCYASKLRSQCSFKVATQIAYAINSSVAFTTGLIKRAFAQCALCGVVF